MIHFLKILFVTILFLNHAFLSRAVDKDSNVLQIRQNEKVIGKRKVVLKATKHHPHKKKKANTTRYHFLSPRTVLFELSKPPVPGTFQYYNVIEKIHSRDCLLILNNSPPRIF